MFYVPDDSHAPASKRSSLRVIQKLTELYAKINPQRVRSDRKRFKTLQLQDKPKRNSLPCKNKLTTLCLPAIQERRFLLKGSEFQPLPNPSCPQNSPQTQTPRKPHRHHHRLSSFKKVEKQLVSNKAARKMKKSLENITKYLEPWVVMDEGGVF